MNLNTVVAQTLNFKNLTIDDGLTSSRVYDIAEDKNGFIWIASDKGVSRFDGSEFRDLDARDGYTGKGAYRIFVSSLGEIWILSIDFRLFVVRQGNCRQIRLPLDVAWVIENDDKEIIGLSRLGVVFRLSAQRDKVYTMFDDKLQTGNTSYYNICHVSGARYIISSSEGIYDVDCNRNQKQCLVLNQTPNRFKPQRVFKTSDGELYAFSLSKLYQLQPNQSGSCDIQLVKEIKGEEIIGVHKDPQNGDLWIGASSGLFQWKRGKSGILETTYLKGIMCYNILLSKEGILWCTSAENGVFHTDISAVHFTAGCGLKNDHISFIRKEGNTIYAIAKDGKVALIENGKVTQQWDLKNQAQLSMVHSVANCTDGLYVIIEQNKFLRIADQSIDNITTPSGTFPLFDNNTYFFAYKGASYFSNPLRFWYKGSENSELAKLVAKERLGNGFVRNLRDSVLLYATRRGFLVIHVNNPDSIDYHVINTTVSTMVETKRGSWFFSTPEKGVYFERFDGKRGYHKTDNMLLSNYCSKVYYHNDAIWVATNKGVSRLMLDADDHVKKVINYTSQDKLNSMEVNEILFDQGMVYVATNKGVSLFSEEIPRNASVSPSVLMDRIQINNKDTTIQPSYVLPFTHNNITLTYSSPSIRSAKNVQFKYAIVGKSNRTIYGVSPSKVLQLGSLAPDVYAVFIWARNIDGLWSAKPLRMSLTILQPFWERMEFILSVAAAILVIALLLVIRRVNQIKERNKVQALLLESELKALRLHMNPHFIFNTLNSLQKFILERNPIEANKYIAKFARLMRWIMIYSDLQHLSLEEEFSFLDAYIELEQLRFDTVFKVEKRIDEQLVASQVFIPALVIQPFVENAIKYGIAGSAGQGELRLVVKQTPDYLLVTIEDNGVGRDRVKAEQLLSGKTYESTGIKYTNERLLLLLGNKLNIENAVTITDLYHHGKPSGTRVELVIPYYYD